MWARGGFSPPDQPVPYVLGESGRILGVVFGDPLHAPPGGDHANKILWVASPATPSGTVATSGALHLHGSLAGSSETVDQVIAGGPGPSIVDVPRPGCWTFELRWSGVVDRVTLRYH